MPRLNGRRSALLFLIILIILLAQVTWWMILFLREVDQSRLLKLQQYGISQSEAIESEAFHQRIMFVSESVFFCMVMMVGLYLLGRALRQERLLREAQRNFVEILSHESKTPLTALKLRIDSLLGDKTMEGEARESLIVAESEVRRLSSVFEKVLNLNRLESQAMHFELVSVKEVIDEVLNHLNTLIQAHQVSVSVTAESEVLVKGDVYCLKNAIQNLVENAILYNRSVQKQVAVTLKAEGGFAVLTVQDNGPGIEEFDSRLLFTRYFRGKQKAKISGTGLGLFLSRLIVEAHRGVIRLVKSSDGAIFEVRLPLSEEVA